MTRIILPLLFSAFYLTSSAYSDTITLWPDKVPGFPANYAHKPFVQKDPERITETSRAFMRVFPADPTKATGHGLLIFPGGGYSILADKKEGDRVAKFFASKGITSFVVCYRVSRKGGQQGYQFPGPLLDARQAMRHVRKNAARYKIDPDKVGCVGFSAGGHLSSMFGTRYNDKLEGDPVSDISVKPAFAAMIYPVVSAIEPYAHGCTRKILGRNPTEKEKIAISAERLLTNDTPPLFLVHNQFDGVSSHNSTVLAQAATKKKVPCELHLYPASAHGFGMGTPGKDLAADWPNLLEKFIKRIGSK
ncbi:MAG: alpha/beta hydrolase [Verrucomicrobiae bacterium]|nr:alpha/beta hydrolase [Verrucomicrobiae bacterium]NNJ85702.1 alpha/beta hydrolase [Akkermansiaceae bacterium]